MARLFPDNSFVAPQYPTGKDLVRLCIAEAPGEEESEKGVPLVGGAGKWFDSILRSAHIPREGLTIANCIQCRPPENIFPTDPDAQQYISNKEGLQAVHHCLRRHVEPLIRSRPWKRVDLFGDKPLHFIAGKPLHGIGKWRGSPLSIPALGSDPKAIATYHPSYIMRDQNMFPVAVNDMMKGLTPPPEYYSAFPELEEVQNFKFTEFAFDIETNGWSKEIVCVGICARPCFAITVPFRGPYIAELKRIFRNATRVIGHNCIQFDLPVLRHSDVTISKECEVYDTMLLQHLVFPSFPHDLEFVGSQFVNKPAWKHEKGVLQIYCARDVDVTLQCFNQLLPMVKKNDLLDLYHQVQVPLAKICHLMSVTGFKVDANRIKDVRAKLIAERDSLESKIPEVLRTFDKPVNKRQDAPPGTLGKSGKPVKFILVGGTERVSPWRSPEVKKRYLYSKEQDCLGFDPILDPKSGRVTTGKVALHKIQARLFKAGKEKEAGQIKALLKLNQLDELITTFAKEDMVNVGRQHPSFNVHGTGTGRLSSSDPNLQNIPEIARYMYVPDFPGWMIVEVDYSGIENRLQTYFAGDTKRAQRLAIPGFSEHKLLASKISGIPYEQIEKSSDPESFYSKAKHVVHGVDRGLGPLKAANMYDMDLKETKTLFAMWKEEIKQTIKWQAECAAQAKREGVLTNPFKRKAWFWTSSAYTESLSFPPQGTAADVIYRAMIALMFERIGLSREEAQRVVGVVEPLPKRATLLLQVHDSLVFTCPADVVDELIRVVRRVMEQPWPELRGLVLPVEFKVGPSWGEVEKYEPDRVAGNSMGNKTDA